jgi:catechol 1,2-dioxygenase
MKPKPLSRRRFLGSAFAGAAAVSAVESEAAQAQQSGKSPKYSDYLKDKDKGREVLPVTENDIEGPFYRPGAPFRTKLNAAGEKGDVLVISGRVVGRDNKPVAGAVLEIWQANASGRYDNDDPDHPPPAREFRLRGKLKTDGDGNYRFETIRPGHYKIGPSQYRPAHIHLKIHAEGYQSVTTQFFFEGEKYNRMDPWFKPALVLDLKPEGERFTATFRIVMARV